MLNRRERKALEEIERQFHVEDPELTRRFDRSLGDGGRWPPITVPLVVLALLGLGAFVLPFSSIVGIALATVMLVLAVRWTSSRQRRQDDDSACDT